MAKNAALGKAKDAKQDEFYTQLADIENELRHYRPHFKGKTILCNCDDPYESNFFKYFALNFNKLKLKKLIATCYAGSPITGTQLSLFGDETDDERRTPYKAVVTTVRPVSQSMVSTPPKPIRTAAPFDAKKASGLRFYKAGHPIKGHQDAWPGYIEGQLGWALEMKKIRLC